MSNAINLNHSYRIPGYLKDKYNKLGKMSINDVINNIKWMTFGDKINYIRHHFTYYDGNQDLFFENDKKTCNYRLHWLNRLIAAVILKKYTPDVLKDFNNRILKWRREEEKKKITETSTDLKIIKPETESIKNISNRVFFDWLTTTFLWTSLPSDINSSHFMIWCKRITILRLYLNSFDNVFNLSDMSSLDLKTILKYSYDWSQTPNKLDGYDLEKEYNITKNRFIDILKKRTTKKEERQAIKYEQYIEEKYAEQKLREYDQYLRSKQRKEQTDASTN